MCCLGVFDPRGYQGLSHPVAAVRRMVFLSPGFHEVLMFQRVFNRSSRTSMLRTRVAVVAASVGTTVALGAGVASAASSSASWVDPVKKYTLSASYAQAGSMWHSTHSGQDFAVPSGTTVVAAHGGTVVKAGPRGAGDGSAYGNAIVIKHGKGSTRSTPTSPGSRSRSARSSRPASASPSPATPAIPAARTCTSRSARPPTTALR